MYTADIGRKFLELYNEKHSSEVGAGEFFEDKFFPLFLNTEDHLHLMQVTNSSFFQKVSKKERESGLPEPEIKKNRFLDQLDSISKGEQSVSGATGVGFMAGEMEKSTSGQVSTLEFKTDKTTLLNTWFGGALGVGFGGGYNFLIDHTDIMWFVYQGWKYYRKYIDETPDLKGRQIETWNGLWLCYGLEYRNHPEKAYNNLKQHIQPHLAESKGIMSLQRPHWLEQIAAIAKSFGDREQAILLYGYNFGQMNKTLGFLYLHVPEIRRLHQLYDAYLETDDMFRSGKRSLQKVYKTQFSLEHACAQGGIGIRSLRPKDLHKFTAGTMQKQAAAAPKLDKEEKRYQFITYLTWITAMLNNEETLKLAEELAQVLLDYEQENKRLTTRPRKIEELWQATNRQLMIDKLVEIQKESKETAPTLNKIVDQIMLELPQDTFRLFLTLTKFKYYFFKTSDKQTAHN